VLLASKKLAEKAKRIKWVFGSGFLFVRMDSARKNFKKIKKEVSFPLPGINQNCHRSAVSNIP